jgi:16S rRNA (cytosine1402-N4)-methyltransferase
VSFHSLEDRPVKNFLRDRSDEHAGYSRHMPGAPARRPATFRLISKKAIKPSAAEIAANPRARSAKLRVAERTDVHLEARP